MVRSYCVTDKKYTECVTNTEVILRTSNGKYMMQCKCAECGNTKSKFIKRPKN